MQLKYKAGLFASCLSLAVMGQQKEPTGGQKSSTHLPAKAHHKRTKIQYGIASYYANKFEGRLTYTDEVFTQKKLTAASNTLPMHTWVRVTNVHNHRTVIVRINDKMHPENRRLIDLSLAAAKRLGFAGKGLTRVRIDVLGKRRPPEAEIAVDEEDRKKE